MTFPESIALPTAPAARRAAFAAASSWAAMFAIDAVFVATHTPSAGLWLTLSALSDASAALILAVRHTRLRLFFTDAFFPLLLLSPLLIAAAKPFDRTLLAAAILGLLTAAIVGMHRERFSRYLAVGGLALLLPLVNKSFLLMLPPLIVWLGVAGYFLTRAPQPGIRVRGFGVMAIAEVGLMLFGLACLLEPAASTPAPAQLFATIVSFADFPLIVAGIMGLALAWGRRPQGDTPPYLAGLLALLVGMLAMLLNNFQAGGLPPPGADQTLILLCIIYTIFALGSPPALRWALALLLLAAGTTYIVWRPYAA